MEEYEKVKAIGSHALLLGIVLIVLCQVLPIVRFSQVMTHTVPTSPLVGGERYWIDTIITPTIPEGAPFSLTIKKKEQGQLYLQVFPSTHSGDPVGPILLRSEVGAASLNESTIAGKAPQTAQYLLIAVVFTGRFELTIVSIWSPFEWLKPYSLVGIALALGGGILLHFSKTVAQTLEAYERRGREK